jgi:hypothetical protein
MGEAFERILNPPDACTALFFHLLFSLFVRVPSSFPFPSLSRNLRANPVFRISILRSGSREDHNPFMAIYSLFPRLFCDPVSHLLLPKQLRDNLVTLMITPCPLPEHHSPSELA